MNPSVFSIFSHICFLGCVWVQFCVAEDSSAEFLNAHNAARIEFGVGNLSWDDGVAAYAELYTKQHEKDCKLVHSGIGPYGENLAWARGDMSAAEAVQLWVSEKNNYNSSTNLCTPGGVCVHYTQVVWPNTVKLGCFRGRCENGDTFITCNYDPRGNIDDQHPLINPVCAPKRLTIKNHIPL